MDIDHEKPRHSVAPKDIYYWGFLCGLGDSGAAIFQQIGLVTVSADKTSFIIGMYVVIVPIITWAIPGCGEATTINLQSWISVALSMLGLYLLSGCGEEQVCLGGDVGRGEFFVFISMIFWVISIIAGDMAAKRVDVVVMTSVAFMTCAGITLTLALLLEPPAGCIHSNSIRNNLLVIAGAACFEAVGFTLGTMGQEHTPPPQAALLFSLSSVVCAAVGYVALDEELSGPELVGCLLMTAAAVLPGLLGANYRWEDLDVFRSMEISSSNKYNRGGDGFLEDVAEEDDDEDLDNPKSQLLGSQSFAPSNSSSSGGWQRWGVVTSIRSLLARGWALLLHPTALVAGLESCPEALGPPVGSQPCP
eukprot:CAMPEP_0170097290 /NCGR_PEP_ID=MMETSP0019_2-20121128/29139_1 /TAXON_ID=98059 /ORGANISM="Dinobryon sp., Strain UTEXLB2267" /LENGTH=361 /DNA_ID=CAMNT_0010319535 /DNA_START=198 /DNA_END=1284 /DNA_ORIENTATION=+